MKRERLGFIALWMIVIFAFFVRVFRVGTNPPGISWDEASIGYNAFSILTTGRDEHGRFMPLDAFAAFGDYKPPVPVYLTVPFVALFGLTELAVRMPSVLAGTLATLLIYLVVTELFGRFRYKKALALTASLLFAVTPWHVMLSRAGFEGNIALTFLLTGIWLVLKAKDVPAFRYVCWLPFVLGVYTFNSARYAGPLIAAGIFVLVRNGRIIPNRQWAYGVLIAGIALLPIAPHLLSKEARLRFEEVSIFTDLRTVLTSNTRRQTDDFSWWSGMLHNRRIGYAREYLIHFLDNLEPRFLFIRGDGNPKFSIQDTGALLLVTAPFLAYGWLTVFRDSPAISVFLVWWLVAAISPSAVARETPHALRIENGLPVFIIVTSYGLLMSITKIRSYRVRFVLITFYFLLITLNFLYFWHNLMAHYPKEYSGEWQYGYKQAIEYAKANKDKYDTIVLTESIGRPYIYALFYGRYPLDEFIRTKDASFDAAGFYNVYGFDTYRFTNTGIGDYKGKTLYILPPKDVPISATVKKTIRLLNNDPVLVVFE